MGLLNDINVLTGSQDHRAELSRWIKSGNFDVIIDYGGHRNIQIWNSFNILFFEALSLVGFYLIEDLQVGRIYHPIEKIFSTFYKI